jgi:eukaryotic-like serine/threonine-protein kinase
MQRLQIDPRRWAELNSLLDTALDLPPERRDEWLAALDSKYEGLEPQLVELLRRAARIETEDFLNTLPKLAGLPEPSAQAASEKGAAVGPYRLIRELGAGGMGSVWLAQRNDGFLDNRPVALKLPHGPWHRAGLAERLAREREILAALNHVNIARLYDAGVTSEGQPYLAIEYVEGRPIDAYCHEQRLGLKQRIQLFLQVIDAAAYAHGKLILHRDLKPANILVTPQAEVRLLDFGIAKLLQEGRAHATSLTSLAGRALMPDHASPEQILGEPLSVASDVYSLGVVLYELLSGTRPYRLERESRGALEDAIVQVDPERPSEVASDPAVRRELRGDLDTIVLKALKKKATERYATANALAEDLQRFLARRPVLARRDTVSYRLSRFAVRNKLAVGASGAVLLAIVVGAGLSLWQAKVATAEKNRADEVKQFLAAMLEDANLDNEKSRSLSVREWLLQSSARIDAARIKNPEVRVELLTLIGSGLLGAYDIEATVGVLSDAVAEAKRSLGAEHLLTARAQLMLCHALFDIGRIAEARTELTGALAVVENSDRATTADLTRAWRIRAKIEIEETHYDAAVRSAQRAMQLADADPTLASAERGRVLAKLATAYSYADKPAEALAASKAAFQLARTLYEDNPLNPGMFTARMGYARALRAAGQHDAAISHFERACADSAKLHGDSSSITGTCIQNMVQPLLLTGRIDEALTYSERAFRISESSKAPGSMAAEATANAWGKSLLAARRAAQAEQLFQRVQSSAAKIFGAEHEFTARALLDRALALAYAGRVQDAKQHGAAVPAVARASSRRLEQRALFVAGVTHRIAGDYALALSTQRQARAITAQLESGSRGAGEVDDANVVREIGMLHVELDQLEAARPALEEAIARYGALYPHTTPDRAEALMALARLKLSSGDAAGAVPLLEDADRAWSQLDPESRWAGEVAFWLAQAHSALGQHSQAEATFERAKRLLADSPWRSDAQLLASLLRRGV